MSACAPPKRGLALGGGALLGTKLVRLTYLDEGGTAVHEPHVVVAGPIVHGDYQLVPVENHLRALLEKHIPPKDQRGFVFHATNIWSGTRYFKDREAWPFEKRYAILEELAKIPNDFALPVAFGIANKAAVLKMLEGEGKPYPYVDHMTAFANAAQQIELFFRGRHSSENTVVIAEDRPKVRKALKQVQLILQDRGPVRIPDEFTKRFPELPFSHIRDTVHFAAKSESPMLQVADICAFLLRGFINENVKTLPLFAHLKPALLPLPGEEPQ